MDRLLAGLMDSKLIRFTLAMDILWNSYTYRDRYGVRGLPQVLYVVEGSVYLFSESDVTQK